MSTARPPEIREQLDRIASMRRRAGWDGLGAKAITSKTCKATCTFWSELRKDGVRDPDYISPSALGAISLQWVFGDASVYARVNFSKAAKVYLQWNDGRGQWGEQSLDLNEAVKKVKAAIRQGDGR